MRLSSLRCASHLCLFAVLSFIAAGCSAGSSSSGTNSNPPPPQAPEFLYAKGPTGVLAFQIDLNTGNLTAIQTVDWAAPSGYEFGSPQSQTQLVATPSGNFLYVIHGIANAIDAFAVNANGQLSLVSGSPFSVPEGNSFLSGLAIDPTGVALYAVDGINSMIIEFQINPATGALTLVASPYMAGNIMEQVIVDPSGNSLYATDDELGNLSSTTRNQEIDGFSITPSSGNLATLATSPYIIPSLGFSDDVQPTEIAIDPSGSFVYVALDDSLADSGGSIAGFTRNSTTGELTPMANSPFASESSSSTTNTQTTSITIHPSGKFMYALNDTDNSISAFSINAQTGALTAVAGSPFRGQGLPAYPNELITYGPIVVDPSGQYLYVLMGAPAIAVYKINQTTGALTVPAVSPVPISDNIFSMTIVQVP